MEDAARAQQIVEAIGSVFRGARRAAELTVAAWLARGHMLIEDVPGVGKTTLARALAAATGGSFKRVQCVPDLMPADITGTSIWDEHDRRFVFHPGPVFADVLLADELNRTPPRTQSALLEALAEGQVSVDGVARLLPTRFCCLATQNPIDHAGTYPLPDSQRDRFLLRFGLGYPDQAAELELLRRDGAAVDLAQLRPVVDTPGAEHLRTATAAVQLSDEVRSYILALVRATRGAKSLALGASPRAALGLQRIAQARALLAGRSFAIPDDVQGVAVEALAHRVVPRGANDAEQAVRDAVATVAVPR
ncbi:MAG: MoxR family ATPase [Planctomycetota bacterium]